VLEKELAMKRNELRVIFSLSRYFRKKTKRMKIYQVQVLKVFFKIL